MKIIESIIPKSKSVRPGKVYVKKYIIIHETDNRDKGANAKAHANLLMSKAKADDGYYVSYNYAVDDKNAYHMIPDNEKTFNCANNDGNKHGIAIEICVNSDGDYEKALLNAAELVAELYKTNKMWSGDMRQHNDFNGKNCPRILRETKRWKEFLNMCDKAYDKKYGDGSKKPSEPTEESEEEEMKALEKCKELEEKVTKLEARIKKLENPMIYNYIDGNMPEWARATIEKLFKNKMLKGNEKGELGLTDDMLRMFVILDRAGIYEKNETK